jgi:hypothetical protein
MASPWQSIAADALGSHGLGSVRSEWSQRFEIVAWIDGFADLQTLVVVRK